MEELIFGIYRKKIWSNFVKAIKDFDMIQPGDRIAVGISGGKDSLLLAKLFSILKRDKSRDFEVKYISLDPGFEDDDREMMHQNVKNLGIDCNFFDGNVWDVAFELAPDNPCFLCAKMRRGILLKKVEELGCNKLALGHHFDDIVETTLINMFYAGTVKTMLPKVKSTSGNMEIIRPLCYVHEKNIISFTHKAEVTPMTCGCPVEGNKVDSKRKETKLLLAELEKTNKNLKQSIFNSMKNVNLSYVLGYTHGNKNEKRR